MFKKATLLILMVLTICISAPSHARHYGFDLKETGLIFEYLNDKYKEITDVEVMVNSMYKDYAIASVYAPNFEGKTEILHKLNGNWVTFASGSKLTENGSVQP